MCRITAVISANPGSSRDLLCGGPKSLLMQAGAAPEGSRGDGWGVAFYRHGTPTVIKSPRPARLGKKHFEKAASSVSRITLAHLGGASAASGSRKNPGGKTDTQPFSGCGLAFAHTGALFIKEEIKNLLGRYASRVKGSTGSEILFWQAVKMMDAYGSPETALEMALDEIRTVWISCRDKYPRLDAPYSGLNMFLAARDSLAVLCHSPFKKKPNALLTPAREFGRVAWRREKERVVFSSEPADAKAGWEKMRDPEIAFAALRGGKLALDFKRILL